MGLAGEIDFGLHGVGEEEEVGLLRDISHKLGDGIERGLAGVEAQGDDAAARWLEQARDQLEDSGLARAVAPHDGGDLACVKFQAQAVQHLVPAVAEPNIL